MAEQSLPQFTDSPACQCATCRSFCSRPCWPIPEEIASLVESGKSNRLMLDWWEGDFHDGEHDRVFIVSPASPGYEGLRAPEVSPFDLLFGDGGDLKSGCTFFRNGDCELHACGLKPTEGRVGYHEGEQGRLHEDVARTWDTDQGRAVVARWCLSQGMEDPAAEPGEGR